MAAAAVDGPRAAAGHFPGGRRRSEGRQLRQVSVLFTQELFSDPQTMETTHRAGWSQCTLANSVGLAADLERTCPATAQLESMSARSLVGHRPHGMDGLPGWSAVSLRLSVRKL